MLIIIEEQFLSVTCRKVRREEGEREKEGVEEEDDWTTNDHDSLLNISQVSRLRYNRIDNSGVSSPLDALSLTVSHLPGQSPF